MIRFQIMSSRVAHRVGMLTRYMPPLSTPTIYEQPVPHPAIDFTYRASRNRWDRADLVSAIGQDPPDADAAIQIWPPPEPRQ